MAAPDWAVFAQLHPKLAAQIELSPEFAALAKPVRVSLPAAPRTASPVAPAPATPTTTRRPPPPAAAPAGAGSGFDDMPGEFEGQPGEFDEIAF